MRLIYLDYNASTPVATSVREALWPFLGEHYGNPSSGHALGRGAHEAVEDAREQVAGMLGADREEIVFTSGGTESNNLAILGAVRRHAPEAGAHVVISALEHPAVVQPVRALERLGYQVTLVGCSRPGVVLPESIAAAMRPNTVLVSVMHANNEIGTIQPIRAIADICHARGALLHTDAAQSIGKIAVDVRDLGADLLTVAGHKMYAPKGVGALYVKSGVALEPVMFGAAHEAGLRPGTENVPGIVALGKAAHLVARKWDEHSTRMEVLRDKLFARLLDGVGPRLLLHGAGAPRLPNTLSVSFPEVVARDMLSRIPELCASTGAACHSGTTTMSATLAAIGATPDQAAGMLRLSLGWSTTDEEIERAANLLLGAWEQLHGA